MTNEEILKIAREAGFDVHQRKGEIRAHPDVSGMMIIDLTEAVNKFAALVAAAEREECAKICDEMVEFYSDYKNTALSNAASGEPRAATAIATLIRARKELTS